MKPGYIVAIGGSAGSLIPLVKFVGDTPSDNISYVVLRHIAHDAVSHLNEILKKHSKLEIKEIEDMGDVESNKLYLLPAGYYAILGDGKFVLIKRTGYPNCAIDVFMNSLAQEYKERAIAIIFSGSGKNGSEGIINIKKYGGLVLVQQPESCEFPYMPQNAISTGCVDKILLPEEMPGAIKQYEQQIVDTT